MSPSRVTRCSKRTIFIGLLTSVTLLLFNWMLRPPTDVHSEISVHKHSINEDIMHIARNVSEQSTKYVIVVEYAQDSPAQFINMMRIYNYHFNNFELLDHIQHNDDELYPKELLILRIENKLGVDSMNHNFQFQFGFIQNVDRCNEAFGFHDNKYNVSSIVGYNYWNDDRKINEFKDSIYMPLFFSYDFNEKYDYGQDIYPLIYNFTEHELVSKWNERQSLLTIYHKQHTEISEKYNYIYDNIMYYAQNELKYMVLYSTDSVGINIVEYRQNMLQSRFVLCSAESNPETHQFYEALSCGAIPILSVKTSYYLEHECKNSYNGFLFYNQPWNRKIDEELIFELGKMGRWIRGGGKWKFSNLNIDELDKLFAANEFLPAIILRSETELESFLDFVAKKEKDNKQNSDKFWNTFQFYANRWFINMIEFKMKQFENVLSHAVTSTSDSTSF